MGMDNDIVIYFLKLKLYVFQFLRYMRSKIMGISEVICLINGMEIHYMTFRFTIIKFLKYIQSLMQSLIDMLDERIHKAQLIKNYPDGQQTIIVCPKVVDKDELTITDLVNITNSMNETKDDRMGDNLYMKFEVECPTTGVIDLKGYLIKYKDLDKAYSHTLDNIMTFNNHQVTDDAIINIKTFLSGKIVTKSLAYGEFKDRHLVEFNSIDEEID